MLCNWSPVSTRKIRKCCFLCLGSIPGYAPTEQADTFRSDLYFSAARNRLNLETGYISLESVQARLMQCLYLLASSRANQAWYHFGSTIQLVFAREMHRRRLYRGFPEDGTYIINECRKRTFWAAYTLDRYLGVLLGRPRIFQDEDIDQDYPAHANDDDMTTIGLLPRPMPDDCLEDAPIFLSKYAALLALSLLPFCITWFILFPAL